jgi:hypothetical protein
LRPLSFGELLDRIFSLYRRHLWLFVGIMAIPSMITVAMAFLLPSSQQPFPVAENGSGPDPAQLAGFAGGLIVGILIMSVVYWVVYSIALGATSFAVSEVQQGRSATVRGSYQRMSGKIWRLIGIVLSIFLRAFGLVVLLTMASTLVAIALGSFASPVLGGILGGLFGVLGWLVGMGLAVWIILGYGVAIPAAILEDIRGREALKRSMLLTKGHRGKVFLILLLTSVLTYASIFIFQGPFWLASAFLAAGNRSSVLLAYLSAISGGVAGAFVGPLMMIGLALLYFDLRIRKEGLDLQLMMDTLDQDTIADAPPASSRPPPVS